MISARTSTTSRTVRVAFAHGLRGGSVVVDATAWAASVLPVFDPPPSDPVVACDEPADEVPASAPVPDDAGEQFCVDASHVDATDGAAVDRDVGPVAPAEVPRVDDAPVVCPVVVAPA